MVPRGHFWVLQLEKRLVGPVQSPAGHSRFSKFKKKGGKKNQIFHFIDSTSIMTAFTEIWSQDTNSSHFVSTFDFFNIIYVIFSTSLVLSSTKQLFITSKIQMYK